MNLRRLALVASLAFGSLGFAAGCSGDNNTTDDDIAPIDEATDDVVSVSKLLGTYSEGQGRYASLTFSQVTEQGGSGRRANKFEGKQIVQCVTAPCPTVNVAGKWFARGDTLSLYPEGAPRENYKATLSGSGVNIK